MIPDLSTTPVLVPVTPDAHAIVDFDDLDLVAAHSWYVVADGYVGALVKRKRIYMHRLIADPPEAMWVDHRNHNPLDNRRDNLRVCTPSQNRQNARRRRDGASRFKGVSREEWNGYPCWRAAIGHEYQNFHIGTYPFTPEGEEEAARAYDEKARELFGEFAALNFPAENEVAARRKPTAA